MMHWGIYSVPAHGSEWYVRYMYSGNQGMMDWHTQHFGPPTKFGYKDFLPMFTAANWDPNAWANLFKKAGAKYVFAPGGGQTGKKLRGHEHQAIVAPDQIRRCHFLEPCIAQI